MSSRLDGLFVHCLHGDDNQVSWSGKDSKRAFSRSIDSDVDLEVLETPYKLSNMRYKIYNFLHVYIITQTIIC